MKKYKVKIEPDGLADIKGIVKWYEEQRVGLGRRFHDTA